ncbi:hypothetical protein P691DRAFT_762901 [Macrolepiota fuliginosa MF-IS2]|uniref:Uncharacterized protein n=1 Tax=Macrolepiota fuliginosa MF-IS2 TaxID=1400762 RepID=A0A9P5X8Y8_9AGAR|nr:hypothetical protein P691DRAFT_762901 [Macrolepiota fuliginosa MF-IS2]
MPRNRTLCPTCRDPSHPPSTNLSLPPINEEDVEDDDDMQPFGLELDDDYAFFNETATGIRWRDKKDSSTEWKQAHRYHPIAAVSFTPDISASDPPPLKPEYWHHSLFISTSVVFHHSEPLPPTPSGSPNDTEFFDYGYPP